MYICSNWSYCCLELYTSQFALYSIRVCGRMAFHAIISRSRVKYPCSRLFPVVAPSTEPTTLLVHDTPRASVRFERVNFVSPHLENYISKLARSAQNPETNTRSVRHSPSYDWLELTNQAGGKIRWTRCTTVHEMEERWNVGQKGKEEGIQVGGGRIETTKATRIFLLSGGKHGNYLLYDGMGGQSVRPFIKLNERIQRWTRRAVSVVRHWKKAKRRRTRRWKWGDERRRKASPRPWTKGGTTICNYVSFYPIPS